LSDNAKRPVGTKRNDLLNISKGNYVCFIDDDDRISETYVDDILQEIINWSPDVIVFDAEITFNGTNPKLVKYGREYDYCEKYDAYYRHPNHLMVHKKENITEYFKDIKTGEDDEWASRMLSRIVTQSRINKVLYYYDYNTSTKKYFE
jgi:glycosyltransferase involved in cell wall biosynthesis